MSTLLLRLAAPLQSWGVDAKFDRRGTERAPTKSGVIGLIAAALGRRRNDSIEDLQTLRFGVRIDQAGTLLRDYHTAKSKESAYVTNRYYLADAVFLVGLEGDPVLLADIEYALHYPVFPLFLGRRSCPPEGPVSLGVRVNKTLVEALQEEAWLIRPISRSADKPSLPLRLQIDATDKDVDVSFVRDVPLSFDQTHRQYGYRRVCLDISCLVSNPNHHPSEAVHPTQHNPMPDLEG